MQPSFLYLLASLLRSASPETSSDIFITTIVPIFLNFSINKIIYAKQGESNSIYMLILIFPMINYAKQTIVNYQSASFNTLLFFRSFKKKSWRINKRHFAFYALLFVGKKQPFRYSYHCLLPQPLMMTPVQHPINIHCNYFVLKIYPFFSKKRNIYEIQTFCKTYH